MKSIDIRTHERIDKTLCGEPQRTDKGSSLVSLQTNTDMAVDDSGLVHGGFIFGVADYAAMLAVNHPHVVLGAADVRFLKPVKVGDVVEAQADVQNIDKKKHTVNVVATVAERQVFKGRFDCFVLEKHVLNS